MGHRRHCRHQANSDDELLSPAPDRPRWHLHPRPSSEVGLSRPSSHRHGHHGHSHQRVGQPTTVQVFKVNATPLSRSPTDFPRPTSTRNELDLIGNMPSYLDIANRSPGVVTGSVRPKSRLLVSDLDNTLFAPAASADSAVQARTFMKTFIRYIMHPESPYSLAIWTFSGRSYGEAHLRSLGVGKVLFADDDPVNPALQDGLVAFWGYEQSGLSGVERQRNAGPAVKDLDKMWDMLNMRKDRGSPKWSPLNSLIVDDQPTNAAAQPDSLVAAPLYTALSPDDDFLLQLIGLLDELAFSDNFAASLRLDKARFGIDPADAGRYAKRGEDVCLRMGVKIARGRTAADYVASLQAAPRVDSPAPVHDDASSIAASETHSMEPHTPNRLAEGMITSPSKLYLQEVDEPSQVGQVKAPLICFDLDGTLYTRPPHNLEHDPEGQPAGRPYLRSMLKWLLNYSPFHVAIWTGSQKATAVRCLDELDLGIVGPKLVGQNKDQAELLHPKLVAVWAREDVGLTDKDYHSYVAIVKDFDKLWDHLKKIGAGDWSPYNTVMVDDTPSKLRAQPDTLIAAPTFDYPLDPSPAASKAMLDTFLLQLIGMLDELAPETNFAHYISSEHWYEGVGARNAEFVRKGVDILKGLGLAIDAEGRSPIPRSARAARPSVTIPKTVTVLKSQAFAAPSSPSTPATAVSTPSGFDAPAATATAAPSARQLRRAPLTTANLSDVSTDSEGEDAAETTDDEKNRFIREVEARSERSGRRQAKVQRAKSHNQRLGDAVEDWELLSDDPDAEPKEVPSPYYQAGRR